MIWRTLLNTAALWGIAVSAWRIYAARSDGDAGTAPIVFLAIALAFYIALPFARCMLASSRVCVTVAIVAAVALASAVGYAGFAYYAPSIALLALIAVRYDGAG